ncbi:MAG TPA: hypothetical protein DCX25_04185 [Candidatus Pacebacteria bacterium]|nr:hypothetical protein [Candidatus Paceibacterota bacterium]HCR10826.1 hypothetical protein [Candidatus Paceibacterota bacterium]HCR93284.1 hypothetical protein [Candidatus Paceibacterota bacterium]
MTHSSAPSLTFSQKCAIGLVNAYRAVYPVFRSMEKTAFGRAPECIHSPTCSEYAARSIQKYGTMRGLLMGMKRILSCRS